MLAVRTNNLFLALLVKIKVLVAYAVSKNYVVVILLIILSYTVYSHSICPLILFFINGIKSRFLLSDLALLSSLFLFIRFFASIFFKLSLKIFFMLGYLPVGFIDFFTDLNLFSFDVKVVILFIHCVILLFLLSVFAFENKKGGLLHFGVKNPLE